MVSAKQTMSKLVLKNQINFHQKLLDKKEEELKDLLAEKRELIGYTAETYVEKKVSAEYLRHSLYKDTNIKECTFCIKCDTEIDEEDYICCNCIDDTDGRNQNFFNIKKEKE